MTIYTVLLICGYLTEYQYLWVLRDEQGDILCTDGRQLRTFETLRDVEQWHKQQGDPKLVLIYPPEVVRR